MTARLRIARLPAARVPADWETFLERYHEIQRLIRRYLPSVCVSLLAEPRPCGEVRDNGLLVDWYSDFPGQPQKLRALPDSEQPAVEMLLQDRLQAIRDLAERLEHVEPTAVYLRHSLLGALEYPGEDCVFVVEGQPVLVFWGDPPGGGGASGLAASEQLHAVPRPVYKPPETAAAEIPPCNEPYRPWRRWLLVVLALLLLLAGWFYLQPRLKQWLAPDYWVMYQAAAGDCGQLEELQLLLHQPGMEATAELLAVREAVARDRLVCEEPDYWGMYNDTAGDCDRLQALQQRLMAEDVVVTDELTRIRDVLARDSLDCRRVYYSRLLEQAGEDCAQLAAISGEMSPLSAELDATLQALWKRWLSRLADCRLQQLEAALDEAKGNCDLLKSLADSLSADDLALPGFDGFHRRLDAKLAGCQKQTAVDPRNLCPGVRPKTLAPDLVLVVDASNSMNAPINVSDNYLEQLQAAAARGNVAAMSEFIRLMDSDEKRIDVARRAARSVVESLPEDVDTGLVLVSECPTASKRGLFSGTQRARLTAQIDAIRTVGGTPLASGIQKASEMVDGIKAPALIVVISDGAESCHGNPCAVAASLARSRPLLKINVVDIMGSGAASCAARLTGGEVLTARNAAQFEMMLDSAVDEVKGPANCIRR